MIQDDFWQDAGNKEHACKVIDSLLNINAFLKIGVSRRSEAIEFAVRQNSASNVQPISPFQWAVIIKADNHSKVEDYVNEYNEHPSVMAAGEQLEFSSKRHWVITKLLNEMITGAFSLWQLHLNTFKQKHSLLSESLLEDPLM